MSFTTRTNENPQERSIETFVTEGKREQVSLLERGLGRIKGTIKSLRERLEVLGIISKSEENNERLGVGVQAESAIEKTESEQNFLAQFNSENSAVFSEKGFEVGADVNEKLREAREVKLGDAHGSALKILRGMVLSGFVDQVPEDFVSLYANAIIEDKNSGFGTAKTENTSHQELLNSLDSIVFRQVPGRKFVLIGDLLMDRGYSDDITLRLLKNAREQLVDSETGENQIEMLGSNHDHEVLVRILGELNISYRQSGSGELTVNPSLYRDHFKNLKLLHCTFGPDGSVIGIDTHAPVSQNSLNKLLTEIGFNGSVTQDNIVEVIDQINRLYQSEVAECFSENLDSQRKDELLSRFDGSGLFGKFVWDRVGYKGSNNGTEDNPFSELGLVHTFGHDSSNAENQNPLIRSIDSSDGKTEAGNVQSVDDVLRAHDQEMRLAIVEAVPEVGFTVEELKEKVADMEPWFGTVFDALVPEVRKKIVEDGVFASEDQLKKTMDQVDQMISIYEAGGEPQDDLKMLENDLIFLKDNYGLGSRIGELLVFARRDHESRKKRHAQIMKMSEDRTKGKSTNYYNHDIERGLDFIFSTNQIQNATAEQLLGKLPFSIQDAFVSRIIEMGEAVTREQALNELERRFQQTESRLKKLSSETPDTEIDSLFNNILSDTVAGLRTFFTEKAREIVQEKRRKKAEEETVLMQAYPANVRQRQTHRQVGRINTEYGASIKGQERGLTEQEERQQPNIHNFSPEQIRRLGDASQSENLENQKVEEAESFVSNLRGLTDMIDNLQVEGLGGISEIKTWTQGWSDLLREDPDVFEDYISRFEEARDTIKDSLKNNYTNIQRGIEKARTNSNQKKTAFEALNRLIA